MSDWFAPINDIQLWFNIKLEVTALQGSLPQVPLLVTRRSAIFPSSLWLIGLEGYGPTPHYERHSGFTNGNCGAEVKRVCVCLHLCVLHCCDSRCRCSAARSLKALCVYSTPPICENYWLSPSPGSCLLLQQPWLSRHITVYGRKSTRYWREQHDVNPCFPLAPQ